MLDLLPELALVHLISHLDVQSLCGLRHLMVRLGWLDDFIFLMRREVRSGADLERRRLLGDEYFAYVQRTFPRSVALAIRGTPPSFRSIETAQVITYDEEARESVLGDVSPSGSEEVSKQSSLARRACIKLINGHTLYVKTLPFIQILPISIDVFDAFAKLPKVDIRQREAQQNVPIFMSLTRVVDECEAGRYLEWSRGDVMKAIAFYRGR